MKCHKCGKKMPIMSVMTQDLISPICNTCQEQIRETQRKQREEQQEQERQLQEQERQLQEQAKSVIVSTTPSLNGWTVTEYLGIESVEFVIGTGPISELVSEVQDFFGARSSPFEKKLQAAKQTAFDSLKYRAAERGGNAVIGVDLDYVEFTGNRIGLIVNGTVVLVARDKSQS